MTTPHDDFLLSTGHALALGGPGSGKTHRALQKAGIEVRKGLLAGQRVLFLSFARATVVRIINKAAQLVDAETLRAVEINTYHSFAWNILKSHAYLLTQRVPVRVLSAPDAAAMLAGTAADARGAAKRKLFDDQGLVHFDLFAPLVVELLTRSKALCRIVAEAYPVIIVDEFQDTNAHEWAMLRMLGSHGRLIALADPDQRIYEFRGADPARIGEFIRACNPVKADFGTANHRSAGTDILAFANDVLAPARSSKAYKDVIVSEYGYYGDRSQYFGCKAAVIASMRRLMGVPVWSIAVLVPTNSLMRDVSDYLLATSDQLPAISHEVALDMEGPALAAVVIAGVLEAGGDDANTSALLVRRLCAHIRGRKGERGPNATELSLTTALADWVETSSLRGKKRIQLVNDCRAIAARRRELTLTGDPGEDWLAVRALFDAMPSAELRQVADDAKFLRLLRKGAALRARLGELWRATGTYAGAADAVRDALIQEHFAMAHQVSSGVHVMTIYKSKGKEFDEVIIYEGRYQGRIVRGGANDRDVAQARLALRVAVSRGMRRVTILTPRGDVCPLLR